MRVIINETVIAVPLGRSARFESVLKSRVKLINTIFVRLKMHSIIVKADKNFTILWCHPDD